MQLVNQEELDMEDDPKRYCASALSCQVTTVGLDRVVQSWYAHRIPGKTKFKCELCNRHVQVSTFHITVIT